MSTDDEVGPPLKSPLFEAVWSMAKASTLSIHEAKAVQKKLTQQQATIDALVEDLRVLRENNTYAWQTVKDLQAKLERSNSEQRDGLNGLAREVHRRMERWWTDLATGERLQRNKGELLMLIVSEIAEAMEGERKDLMDTHLPHRKMAEVEMADTLIRLLDYCGGYGHDIQGAFWEKLAYNDQRADHTAEARQAEGGKKW